MGSTSILDDLKESRLRNGSKWDLHLKCFPFQPITFGRSKVNYSHLDLLLSSPQDLEITKKMSKKNLIITAVALSIIAVAAHFIGTSKNSGVTTEKVGQPMVSTEALEGLDRIKITSPDAHIELVKTENQWEIAESDGFPVNLEKLIELTENLTTYKVASLVTKDPQRMAHFEVNYKGEAGKLKGTQIIFESNGKESFKMIMGKSRTSAAKTQGGSGGTFIRIGSEKEVYLIKESIYLDADPNDWTQRHLFKAEKKEIQAVHFKLKRSGYVLSRKDEKASFTLADLKKGEGFNASKISDLFIEFKDFNFRKRIKKEPKAMKGLRLKSSVTLQTFENAKLTFKLFEKRIKKDEKEYFVELLPSQEEKDLKRWKPAFELGERWIFEISSWKAERWFRKRAEYLK